MDKILNELIELESKAIQKNIDFKLTPISNLDFIVLKSLNNESSFKIHISDDNGVESFPKYFYKDISDRVGVTKSNLDHSLKKLFLKGYIDYVFIPSQIHSEIIRHSDLNFELLKMGKSLDEGWTKGTQIKLTKNGLMALIEFSLEVLDSSIEKQEIQMKNLSELTVEVKKSLQESKDNVLDIDKKISKFHENIFTIFSIMIAAFAVIGININSIPNIEGKLFLNIIVINLSLILSLLVLFTLLKILIHKEKSNRLIWLVFGYGVLLVISAFLLK